MILGTVAFVYKPIYSVTLNGEFVGYSDDKSKLQRRINDYIENGEMENVAFVQVEMLPEYKLCLLKKGITSNDDEIFTKVKETGTAYYKYYAITESNEEKLYVSNFQEAEKIVEELKTKNSSNKDNLGIIEKYDTGLKDFSTSESAVATLYKEPVVVKTVAKTTKTSSVNTSRVTSNAKISLSISFINPTSGSISSRFGRRSGGLHTGIDIAAAKGTSIYAAASGTVTYAGTQGGYGKLVVISHGNGVQTYYAHCNTINVSAGTYVQQGQYIAAMGSTGNSTGPHLHLEVRVNGVAQNPQNYVY